MSELEEYLQRLCERTFLGLWTYRNPFYNRGHGQDGNEKELCDAIVVFGRKVLLISDKVASLPYREGDELRLWQRWYRRTVAHSMRQLDGAARTLSTSPQAVFRDRRCVERLFSDDDIANGFEVHRIIVVRGAAQASMTFFGGGYGSLGIQTVLDPANDQDGQFLLYSYPFSSRQSVHHILNDGVLDIVLEELDTIADFVSYLEAKERLFERRHVIALGEEDLLAHYLKTINENQVHDFVMSENIGPNDGVSFPPNGYASRLRNENYQRMKIANRESYFVDWLLQSLCEEPEAGATGSAAQIRTSVGDIAALSRVERRVVGCRFIAAINATPEGAYRFSGGWGLFEGRNPVNALVINLPQFDEAEVKDLSSAIFEAYVARFLDEGLSDWVRWNCILFDRPRFNESGRISMYSAYRSQFTEARIAAGKRLANELGLVTKMDFTEITEREYPEVDASGFSVSTVLRKSDYGLEGLRRFATQARQKAG